MYYIILSCIILYCVVLYYIILYYIILYYIILCAFSLNKKKELKYSDRWLWYRAVVRQLSGRLYRLHLQLLVTVKKESVCSCETLVPVCQVAECHGPETVSSNNVKLAQLSTGESFERVSRCQLRLWLSTDTWRLHRPDDDLSDAQEYVNAVAM